MDVNVPSKELAKLLEEAVDECRECKLLFANPQGLSWHDEVTHLKHKK